MKHETSLKIWAEKWPGRETVAQNSCSCGWESPTWLTWPECSDAMKIEALAHRVSELEKQSESALG